MLVISGQGGLQGAWPAKPLKPRRHRGVIQVRMVAATGADELTHAGIAAAEAAVHDADWLAPDECRPAVTGLTGNRRCHDAVRLYAQPRVAAPGRYHRRCRGSGDCSLSSPPGGSSCRHRGLEQRCPLPPRYPRALRSGCPAESNGNGSGPGPCPLRARRDGPARVLAVTHETDAKTMTSVVPGPAGSSHSLLSWCCRPPRCPIVPAGSCVSRPSLREP